MPPVELRLATESDLEATYDLFRLATGDLLARRNLSLPAPTEAGSARALAFRRHALRQDAERFWVAESTQNGQLVGFGIATLRGRLWYLAALHVHPGWQGQGIGRELLRRCLSAGGEGRSVRRIVISDPLNPHSNLLYARHGLAPTEPLVELSGPTGAPARQSRVTRVDVNAMPWDVLDALDRRALGISRRADHELWTAQPRQSLLVVADPEGDAIAGYAYAGDAGIGPAVGQNAAALAATIDAALGWLHESGQATAAIKLPGSSRSTLSSLLRRGFRFEHLLLIGSSAPFPTLNRYAVSVGDALF